MKSPYLIAVLLIGAIIPSFAKDVDSLVAATVAKNFYLQIPGASSSVSLKLVYQCKIESFNPIAQKSGTHIYYVFDINTNGFVIVSGDDVVMPVIGYSTSGNYPLNHLPPAEQKWMDGYKSQVIMAKENDIPATRAIGKSWSLLIAGKSQATTRGGVSPMLTTTWDQGDNGGFYNDDCPADPSLPNFNNDSHHCVTGCVATAMAQILKYWQYPAQGSGVHNYYTSSYGTLSANFGNTTYNWSLMPDNVVSTNSAVATIMYQCGVSVNMEYSADESGAWVIAADNRICAQNAYTTYFGYDASTIEGLRRGNYSDTVWTTKITTELDNSRPVQYVGFGSGGGHTWVCDGHDNNNYFHMNWGWGGYADGYYYLDALNPTVLGAGGGLGEYNSNDEALIGIQPPGYMGGGGSGSYTNPNMANLQLKSAIVVNPDPVVFLDAYSIVLNVSNNDAVNFTGFLSVLLFDSLGNYLSIIDSIDVTTQLKAKSQVGVTFPGTHLLTVPGNYSIGAYYRKTDGNWFPIAQGSFVNPLPVSIIGPTNNVEVYSVITPSPVPFVKGMSGSVTASYINQTGGTFIGQYSAALYSLDGSFVEDIDDLGEPNGLPNNQYYSPPPTFSTSAITAPPGTYFLMMMEAAKGAAGYTLAGSKYYRNPIKVNVVGPTMPPDVYEPDNTEPTAYVFTPNWVSDSAQILTTGSNINVPSDLDYYRINLAPGYNYTITAEVFDSYNTKGATTYTADMLVSYDAGGGWSGSYDGPIPGNIALQNGGSITFLAAPYFAGITGTYLLTINLKRINASGIAQVEDGKSIVVFPDPASSYINITVPENLLQSITSYRISNAIGEVVLTEISNYQSVQKIDVSALSSGVYSLQAIGSGHNFTAKFVVTR